MIAGELVAAYKALEDSATDNESQAAEYTKRADADRWEQCRIVHDAVSNGRYSRRAFAKAVGKSQSTISYQFKIWEGWHGVQCTERPAYVAAYKEVSGDNRTTVDVTKARVRNLTPEDKAALTREFLDDPAVSAAMAPPLAADPPDVTEVTDADDAAERSVISGVGKDEPPSSPKPPAAGPPRSTPKPPSSPPSAPKRPTVPPPVPPDDNDFRTQYAEALLDLQNGFIAVHVAATKIKDALRRAGPAPTGAALERLRESVAGAECDFAEVLASANSFMENGVTDIDAGINDILGRDN